MFKNLVGIVVAALMVGGVASAENAVCLPPQPETPLNRVHDADLLELTYSLFEDVPTTKIFLMGDGTLWAKQASEHGPVLSRKKISPESARKVIYASYDFAQEKTGGGCTNDTGSKSYIFIVINGKELSSAYFGGSTCLYPPAIKSAYLTLSALYEQELGVPLPTTDLTPMAAVKP